MQRLWRRIGWRRVIVTAACLAVWRAMAQISILQPRPSGLFQFVEGNPAYSVVAMGVGPYINALIVFTLLPILSGTIRAMLRDTEGRRRLQRWIRVAAALFALAQAYGLTELLQSDDLLPPLDGLQRLSLMLALAAGTMTIVLLADLMDEFGLGFGYGIFVIYFLEYVPREMARLGDFLKGASTFNDRSAYEPVLAWIAISIALVAVSVGVMRAGREIDLVKGKQVAGSLVFPILMSGILRPAVLANAIVFLPQLVANFYASVRPDVHNWFLVNWTSGGPNPWLDAGFTLLYGGLIAAMSYFIAFTEFHPRLIAERLRREHLKIASAPEEEVARRYLRDVGRRLSLAGALALALMLALVPAVARLLTRGLLNQGPSVSAFDALLISAIVVGVVAAVERKPSERIVYLPTVL